MMNDVQLAASLDQLPPHRVLKDTPHGPAIVSGPPHKPNGWRLHVRVITPEFSGWHEYDLFDVTTDESPEDFMATENAVGYRILRTEYFRQQLSSAQNNAPATMHAVLTFTSRTVAKAWDLEVIEDELAPREHVYVDFFSINENDYPADGPYDD